ncbi:uncharacterized protein [Anas acuta]|uniref:uncharacterized protein isoform X1 n=2 Tax=Anas acuta TaxID=28680 RepID=UPI0035C934A5
MVLCSTQARKIVYVLPDILALLKHEDTDLVYLVLVLLVRILQRIDRLLDRRTAKNMAASLRPLFQHRDSNVRFLAIQFYMDVMDFTEPIEKRHVWPEVRKCLVPLFCHLDDDVEKVAEAALKTLTFAAKFLKESQLKRLLRARDKYGAAEYLAREGGRVTNVYMQQGMLYLKSEHDFARLAAVRFLGLLGRHIMDWREEKLPIICEALKDMADDPNPSIASLASQNALILETVEKRRNGTIGKHTVYAQVRRVWKRMPPWLSMWCWC